MTPPDAQPLTEEERERLLRWATTPENAAAWKVETADVLRWETTVRAVEAERDAGLAREAALVAALEEVTFGSHDDHEQGPCRYCEALERAAALIRAHAEKGGAR